MKKFATTALCLAVLLTTLLGSGLYVKADTESDLVPVIDVEPGTEVEVNQQVLFTGENTTYKGETAHTSDDAAFLQAVYEWDFGDGYSVKYKSGSYHSAMAVTHYYMKPGFFLATMTVGVYSSYTDGKPTGTLLAKETQSIAIAVTGDEPLDGFELLHAPFTPRIAQYVTADIPENLANQPENRVLVTLTGDNDTNITLFDKTCFDDTETFLVEPGKLKAGNYRVTATLFDGQGSVITEGTKKGIWTETFSKTYDGNPKVGADENNAICVNGEPFFPVTTFQMKRDWFADWENYINTAYCVGFENDDSYSPDVFTSYMESAADHGFYMMGPSRGQYCRYATVNGIKVRGRKASNDCLYMKEYILAAKDYETLLMYDWQDEPNLGGPGQKVPAAAMSVWKYLQDRYDQQHPTFVNYYAFSWFFNYYGGNNIEYDYLGSTIFNDRHTFICDVYSSDIYPLHFRNDVRLLNYIDGPIALWIQNMEITGENHLDMLPQGLFIEVTEIQREDLDNLVTPPPTESQVLMEAWLGVVHGAEMINWFPHFILEYFQYRAMSMFKTAMDTYGKIILTTDNVPQITDNCNTRANRVDSITRFDGDLIYLFAVRMTEPDAISGETYNALPENQEPESIETDFSVPGVESGRVYVLDETGAVIREITLKDGGFSDTFAKDAYHIYRIESLDN